MNIEQDIYLNFHTHKQKLYDDEIIIHNLFLQDENLITHNGNKIFFSAGLHPWHADLLTKDEIVTKFEMLVNNQVIIAVGEIGIDKLNGPELEIQSKIFEYQAQLAERYELPLIIHSVKAHNEILKFRKTLKPEKPWVIHNFNGSKQMAFNLIENGFYLSLGHCITNPNSRLSSYLNELPLTKIFLETDDYDIDIKYLYLVLAQKIGKSERSLRKQLINNLRNFLYV
ncbi:MAG: TatD family hydrolase [Bacteroidales bacterium]|nr:TatD family hydrolase [Bacteroidales bacterium]